MPQRVIDRVQAPHPRRIVARDLDHPVDHLLPGRAVVHPLHLLEQTVVFRIRVVRRVVAVASGLCLRTVEQEQEVFRIGIVGIPSEEEQLHVALAQLVLEAVPVGQAWHQLHVYLLQLPHVPFDARARARPGAGRVEVQHQGLTGLCIAAIRIAGLGQQALRLGQGLAPRRAVDPVVHVPIGAGLAIAKADDAGCDRPLRRDGAAVAEDRDELFLVDGQGYRMAQLARTLALGRASLAAGADHGVVPVEADVEHRSGDRGLQPDATSGHLVADADVAGFVHLHCLVERIRADGRGVEPALQELVPVRDLLLLEREDDARCQWQRPSGIGEQTGFAVARRPL